MFSTVASAATHWRNVSWNKRCNVSSVSSFDICKTAVDAKSRISRAVKWVALFTAAELEVDGHSSIYTDFTGCTSAYSSAHDSMAVKANPKLLESLCY